MTDVEIIIGALALGFLGGRFYAWWRRRPRNQRCRSCGSRVTFGGRLVHYQDCAAFPPGPLAGEHRNQ
jgi:hypothetical protein